MQNKSTPSCFMSSVGGSRHIAACCSLLGLSRCVYDQASWNALPKMFQSLLTCGAMQLSLVEVRGPASRSNILAFCATIFVTDAFCREIRTVLPPYLGLQAVRRYLAGDLPALNRDQIAIANARTGINVMMCYSGKLCDHLSSEHLLVVREKMAEAFCLAHHGYRLKEFLFGPIGEEALQWSLSVGFRLRRDYSDYYQIHNLGVPTSLERPWLVGLTKEEALADYGSRASGLFVFAPPRFHFTHCEQAILRHSLAGETDEQIARDLSISHWTVKKRWRAIYERVGAIDGELLSSADVGLGNESRGLERRRHLLVYLQQHLEELRPLSR